MKVVIVGSGKVAEAFAVGLRNAFVDLVGVAGRNVERTEYIASKARCKAYVLPELPKADIYIMAVSDDAVVELSRELDFGNAVVAHTAASVAVDALDARIEHRAVIYPLQTFGAGVDVDFSQVPLFVEAVSAHADKVVSKVARLLSPKVSKLDSERRRVLHLAAVFACNFVNAMYVEAEVIMARQGLYFALLAPLIEQTARNAVASNSPRDIQTGPAVRGDRATIERHLAMLDSDHERELYEKLSDTIWQTSKKI